MVKTRLTCFACTGQFKMLELKVEKMETQLQRNRLTHTNIQQVGQNLMDIAELDSHMNGILAGVPAISSELKAGGVPTVRLVQLLSCFAISTLRSTICAAELAKHFPLKPQKPQQPLDTRDSTGATQPEPPTSTPSATASPASAPAPAPTLSGPSTWSSAASDESEDDSASGSSGARISIRKGSRPGKQKGGSSDEASFLEDHVQDALVLALKQLMPLIPSDCEVHDTSKRGYLTNPNAKIDVTFTRGSVVSYQY